jgi:hypothetical protein
MSGMTSKVAVLSTFALLAMVLLRADASHAWRTLSSHELHNGLEIADLRSAFLQRADIVRYDESNRTPEGLRQQLQGHFDVVLSLLRFATANSIEIAVVRLEAADDHSWRAEERDGWRQKLLAARRAQLQRLAAYRERGIFPLNEGQSARPAPIFVDRHGTACAVGHLVRCSGWSKDVDSIAESNNLVYVPDAAQSPIAAWVLTSGLTLEEAAIIQPGYYWLPNGQVDASTHEPGELTLEKDGLRYSNFRLQAQNYSPPPVPVSTGAKPTLVGLGLLAGKGTYYNPSPTPFPIHAPIGTHWIAIGGSDARVQSPLHSLNALATDGRGQMVVVNFDVAAIAPDERINGISESSYWYWQGFQGLDFKLRPPATATYYLQTTAFDGASSLATLSIDQSTPDPSFTAKSDTASFPPIQQISVEARLWLQDGVEMNTFVLDFNVVTVPESTSAVATALIFTSGLTRRKRGRSSF